MLDPLDRIRRLLRNLRDTPSETLTDLQKHFVQGLLYGAASYWRYEQINKTMEMLIRVLGEDFQINIQGIWKEGRMFWIVKSPLLVDKMGTSPDEAFELFSSWLMASKEVRYNGKIYHYNQSTSKLEPVA